MTVNYKEYALALFELLTEENSLDKCYNEITVIYSAFRENPEYIKLLSSDMVSCDEKFALIEKAFSGTDSTVIKFIKLLISKKVISAFSKCAEEFFSLYFEDKGILSVEVISAVDITPDEENAICEKLKGMTEKKEIRLTKRLNPSLIGGVVLRYNGQEIDYSLKTKLNNLKTRLIEK